MNKAIVAMLMISTTLLTGCAGNQRTQTPQQPTGIIQESNVFENESFALELPAPYKADAGSIQPMIEKDFPIIVFSSSKETIEKNKLIEFTEERLKNKWAQTDARGKIISNENVTIDGMNGIKFTIQYPGRRIDDSNGYLNEYHYSILSGENLFQFWTSASDLDNPEEVSKVFDLIIETISFK